MCKHACLFVVALCAAAVGAQAAEPTPDQVIAYRQSLFKVIGWNYAPMAALVKGSRAWDAAEFQRRAIAVAFAAVQLDEAFTPESEKGADAVSDALPEIWRQPEDFATRLKDFQRTSNALRMAAAGGDAERIRSAFLALRQECNDCHQHYRDR